VSRTLAKVQHADEPRSGEESEFFNQMVEALGIIIDRRSKGRPRKNRKLNHKKNRMCLEMVK